MVFAESDAIRLTTDLICLNPFIDIIHEEMTDSNTIVNRFDSIVIFYLKFVLFCTKEFVLNMSD